MNETKQAVVPGGQWATRRHDTEERILAAARQILLRRTTADSLSLREVARRAGFTPGALYRYFADREDLIQKLYRGALGTLGSYLEQAGGNDPGERLVELGHAYLRFGNERGQDLVLLFESAVPQTDWDRYLAVAWPFTLIVDTFRAGIEGGDLSPLRGLDVGGTAYVYWSLVHGMAILRLGHLANVQGDFDTPQNAAIGEFVAGLRPTERSSR